MLDIETIANLYFLGSIGLIAVTLTIGATKLIIDIIKENNQWKRK